MRANISQISEPTRARAEVRPIEASRSASDTRSADGEAEQQRAEPRMVADQRGELLAAERAERRRR